MSKYSEYYQLLGIQPGDSWAKIRIAYKAQMKKWHPDRYTDNEDSVRRAEEITKQLNQAYQEIQHYFELNGRLPLEREPLPPVYRHNFRSSPPAASPAEATQQVKSDHVAHRPAANKTPVRNMAIAILILLVVAIWIFEPLSETVQDELVIRSATKPTDATSEKPEFSSDTFRSDLQKPIPGNIKTFSIGSTLGEVYTAQGVPTEVDGDVWHYNAAEVHFSNGRVIRWIDSTPPILRTTQKELLDQESQPIVVGSISIGSTHEEVRAILGNPMQETARVWFYGQSQVRFDRNGRVNGWTESPYNPLHIKQ